MQAYPQAGAPPAITVLTRDQIEKEGTNFPAFREGRVKREDIPDENISGIQGWFFNLRRAQFKDD